MIVLYSLIGGFGFGMMYLPGMVMTGYYFDKHRARATGVALCGSGVGSMVIAPVSQELIELLGWEMCLRILAGMILTASIAALAFRPLHRPQVVEQRTYDNDSEEDEEEEAHEHLKKISVSDYIFDNMKHDTAYWEPKGLPRNILLRHHRPSQLREHKSLPIPKLQVRH